MSKLPQKVKYSPGEHEVGGERPRQWCIESKEEGLNLQDYRTNLRAPYIQNVTPNSATVLWRVNAPVSTLTKGVGVKLLQYGQPLAIKIMDSEGNDRYLRVQERSHGINLGWSRIVSAQWEIHRRGREGLMKNLNQPFAIFNRAQNDYLVFDKNDGSSINLAWFRESRSGTPYEWLYDGNISSIKLYNLMAKEKDPENSYLRYKSRDFGINLGWSSVPQNENIYLETMNLYADVWVVEEGGFFFDGQHYSVSDGNIFVSEVSWSYQYQEGVSVDENIDDDDAYWLSGLFDRPIVQFEVLFKVLNPNTVYCYRIVSQGVNQDSDCRDEADLDTLHLAEDVRFKTAPEHDSREPVRFLAVGDLGPGDGKPSYFYDVFDMMSVGSRELGLQFWLALGDIDNDTDGHPNAIDPFFFGVYNAYHDEDNPGVTNNSISPEDTSVQAFRKPPYKGMLGGLPVFPTFGNHDICTKYGSSLRYLKKAYLSSFDLPSERDAWSQAALEFNLSGEGLFYTFRYGNVIFISLGIPMRDSEIGDDLSWYSHWGERQREELIIFMKRIRVLVEKEDIWTVAYFHDHNYALGFKPGYEDYRKIFLHHGVDLVLCGHHHMYYQVNIEEGERDYQAVIIGTGGFGDTDEGDQCRRPGFLMLEVEGNSLRYWKYDTHECIPAEDNWDVDNIGDPIDGRDGVDWQVREYVQMRKVEFGKHEVLSDEDIKISLDENLDGIEE